MGQSIRTMASPLLSSSRVAPQSFNNPFDVSQSLLPHDNSMTAMEHVGVSLNTHGSTGQANQSPVIISRVPSEG